tara:strand:- start:828 stop:1307 length:480 start_codon:yes stop_codon:yes gene_type:complete
MMKKCDNCGMEIPEGRLKIFPETNICSAYCIEEIKLNEQSVRQKYIQEDESKRKEKIRELSEKKNTCIVAYNKYKSNEINKEDYKKEFKKFTWWIKEKIEEMGGWLICNPADFTECKKCGKPAIVFWTKKETYFISCSNYKNGCTWKIWPWTFEAKDND